jgi:nickel-dependent lactate racemase
MKDVLLDYGDGKMSVDLPATSTVVTYGQTYTDPEPCDPVARTREALRAPHGFPPLSEMAGPEKKIVIAFPDRVKGGAHPLAHRRVAIPLILEELLSGGAKEENITLVCAMGLHRQNTFEEWYWYLGREIVDRFYPDRLVNHDGEAPDIRDFGQDKMGNAVLCSPLVANADLTIVLGHVSGNPYGGFSGGHKMVATGLTAAKYIASHHCPSTMHRDDWLGASPHSHMRHQFKSIAQCIEGNIGQKIFAVDAVLNQFSQVLDVHAGDLETVEEHTWPLATKRTNVFLKEMAEPADVLVMGVPRNFHYGPGMGTNPILLSLAIGGQLSRCWKAVREGCVVIAPSVCDAWYNDGWFPSYRETYDALQKYCTAEEFLASEDARQLAAHPDYCYKYSNNFAYHPFHAMSMISGGAVTAKRTSAVYMPGAKAPSLARGMGFIPTTTFDQAMKMAERHVGKNPRILCTPDCFTSGVAVHLHYGEAS